MSKSHSSLQDTVDNFSKLQKNSLELIRGFGKIASQQDENVEVEYQDSDGNVQKISLPTVARIQSEINRIDETVKSLAGLNEGEASVRMPDGTYRQLHLSKVESMPDRIDSLSVPSEFKRKSNWFFEDLITPYLYIDLNLSGQIDSKVRQVKVKRYLLNLNSDSKLEYFNTNFNGESNIDYETFLDDIRDSGITYQLDEDIIDLPLNQLNFKGTFDVEEIRDENVTRNIGGIAQTEVTRVYTLNTLDFLDRTDPENPSTRRLNVGDYLFVNSNARNTKFKVIFVDSAQNEIALERIEGYEAITPGENRLEVFSPLSEQKTAQIGIGYNEHQVIFVKPVDSDFYLESDTYSPGIGFYSNNLSINLPDNLGGLTNLENFYKRFTYDFGVYLFNLSRERLIPSIYAETPSAPFLGGDNFSVRQINQHITESNQAQQLKDLYQSKLSLESEIENLNSTISERREYLSNSQVFGAERKDAESELNQAVSEKESRTKLLKSTIDEIISLGNSNPNLTIKPKYRVRGFWDIPAPQESPRTQDQQIIQFIIQYRYIRTDGNPSNPDLIEYQDNDGNRRSGIFSRWNEYKTDRLKRDFDSRLNRYTWQQPSTQDGDVPNINQLDIPIKYGESVEIRIKSISEAGYPHTEINSDWSNNVIIDFPEELIESAELSSNLVRQSVEEQTRLNLLDELDSRGLNRHIQQQVNIDNRFYAHPATEISAVGTDGRTYRLQSAISSLLQRIEKLEQQLFSDQSTIDVDDSTDFYGY